jgi:DNA-binding transcriptional LysR family regulator
MESGQIEAFINVAKFGSFTKASEALFLTQPSLSARIKSIEKELGEILFHRIGRGVKLTDAGKTLLPYAERSFENLKAGKNALHSARTISSGQLNLASARVISTYVLPEIVKQFHEEYPGIDVTIKTGRSSEVLQMVQQEEAQIGLSRTVVHPEIFSSHLYDEEIVLASHPNHPFAIKGTASIQDIGREPLILYDKGSTYFIMIEKACQEFGIIPNIIMNLDSVEATKQMLERGLGISFLPVNSMKRELEMGMLAIIKLAAGHQVKLPTSVIIRKSKIYAPAVIAFLELLKDIYNVEIQFNSKTES